MIRCENKKNKKTTPLLIKKEKMQCLDYPPLHKNTQPTQNHIVTKQRDHEFFYLSDRQHKNAQVCDNWQSLSRHLFIGDICHVLHLCFRGLLSIEEAIH